MDKAIRLVMMGTGTFAEPTLEALLTGPDPVVGVFTQPYRDTGVKRGSTRQVGRGMKEIAQDRGIAVLQPTNVNTPEGVDMLRQLAPDLLVVAAYGQILSKEVLTVPRMGGINVHASLLPKYRGAAPIAWAIANDESASGVTIIRMSAALDAGDMLDQRSLVIGSDETAGELESRLAPLGAAMALDSIVRLKQGPVAGLKQDKSLVTKAPKLKKEDGLIDWTLPAQRVCCWVRAMQPWPTAYTFWHREGQAPLRLLVGKAQVLEGHSSTSLPGSLLADSDAVLRIACGQGSVVEVLELQPAGKKRMAAKDFLRGYPVRSGDRVGAEQSA